MPNSSRTSYTTSGSFHKNTMAFDEQTATTEASSVDVLQPPHQRGTPWSKWFHCCFPKNSSTAKDRSVDFEGNKNKYKLEYEDPDKSESGLMYFDLPDIEEEEETSNSNNKSTTTIRPAFVEQFWRFIFSLFLLDWLRNKGEQQKRIKHE